MSDFWNEKFAGTDYLYGKNPNAFFQEVIDNNEAGSILIPGDGEGRNGVYAAINGYDVTAFDFSEVAKSKAEKLANQEKVKLNYYTESAENYRSQGKQFKYIGLVFLHLPAEIRKKFHSELIKSLESGGLLFAEFFLKEQLSNNSGGPKSIDMLYNIDMMESDFESLKIISISKNIVTLDEGPLHQGEARTLRILARKV